MLRNVNYQVVEKRPMKYEEDGGCEQSTFLRLDDGTVIEVCIWSWDGLMMTDVGVDKESYDAAHEMPFEDYMKSKGLLCEDVPIDDEDYWRYGGLQIHGGQYRLQYCQELRS